MGLVANRAFTSAGVRYVRGQPVPLEVWRAIPVRNQQAMLATRFVVDPDLPDHRYRPRNGKDTLRDAMAAFASPPPKARRRKKAHG